VNIKYSNFYKFFVKNIIKNEIKVPKINTKKEDITSKNQIDKSEVKNDFANNQVQLAQVKVLKDDGELKRADKSDFK
jgi:methionyl-tRNA formyltransferase